MGLFVCNRVYLRLIAFGVVVVLCGWPTGVRGQAWEAIAEMPIAVAAPAVSVRGREAVVTGGVLLGGGASTVVQVLDLDGLTWSQPMSMLTARYQHAQMTLADGRILIVGGRGRIPGHNGVPLKSCELIDLAENQNATVGDLPMPMRSPTLHGLPDGRVAAVGHHVVAVLDLETLEWSVASSLKQPRREHVSHRLADGTLLIVGGIGRWTIERVDLNQTTSLVMDARLPTALDDLAMVPLPDGRLWIIGGQGLDGTTTDQTWLLTVGEGRDSRLEPGPALGVEHGLADHVVVTTPGGAVVCGGESQQGRVDTELADAFWLDTNTLEVHRLPATEIAHDDAVGFCDGGWAYVMGGQVKESFLGAKVPTPIRAVHRIRLTMDQKPAPSGPPSLP